MSDCWGNEYTKLFCPRLTRSGYLLYAVFCLAIHSPSTDQLCRIQKSRCTYRKHLMLSTSWEVNTSNINVWALCLAFLVGPGSPRTEMVEVDVWMHLGRCGKISSEVVHKTDESRLQLQHLILHIKVCSCDGLFSLVLIPKKMRVFITSQGNLFERLELFGDQSTALLSISFICLLS